ncbi:MAG: ribosome silencing factor [Actinomycetes bacterium]
MTASQRAEELAVAAADAAATKLATDIIAIDVSSKLPLSDVFVVCSAANERQVRAVVDNVEDRLMSMGVKPLHREGDRGGEWVLLDYAEIVVHVQQPKAREFYRLERLWSDCPMIHIPTAVGVGGVS